MSKVCAHLGLHRRVAWDGRAVGPCAKQLLTAAAAASPAAAAVVVLW